MEPIWKNGYLRITGKLEIVEATIRQDEHTVGPHILSVDEAGVQWMLINTNFKFDMLPHKLPEVFPARYTIKYGPTDEKAYWKKSYCVDAINVNDAITKILEAPDIFLTKKPEYEWTFGPDELRLIRKQTGQPVVQTK
jgi:hypothetical protein